jgi:hypothetical protein
MFGPALREAGFEPCSSLSGRDAYQVLSDTLNELVEAGAMPAKRREGAEIGAWAAVHGFATLIIDGAFPLGPRQRADAQKVLNRGLLLALGCDEALPPPAPPLIKAALPGHPSGKRGPSR